MPTYKRNVQQPWFSYIAAGSKTWEGRLNKGVFAEMQPGDTVIWVNASNQNDTVKTLIWKKCLHRDFEKMIRTHTLDKVLPGVKRVSEGVKVYHRFYSKSDIDRFGVTAIGIRVIG